MSRFKLLLAACALLLSVGANAQKDVTSQYITNATLSNGTNGWTVTNFNAPQKGNNTKGFASECYAGWGNLDVTDFGLTQTVTLPAGNYTLVSYAFYRYGLNADTDPTKSCAVLKAGDNEVPIKTLGSITAAGYANSQAEGANAFDSKMYRNTVDFKIDADNTSIEIGLVGKHELKQSWMIAGMFELINNDILATIDAPFDVTGYITNPGFEYRDMTGWTLSEGGAFSTQGNNQGFKVGGFYAEKWQSADNGALTARSMSQTLSGLPAGFYKLTVNMGGDGTYVDLNGKTANWEEDKDYTVGYVLAENEDLVITAGKTAEGTANWIHFDNFRLQFCGDVASALSTLLAQLPTYENQLPATVYSDLVSKVSSYDKSYSDVDELLAAIGAVQELYGIADLCIEYFDAVTSAQALTSEKMSNVALNALNIAIAQEISISAGEVNAAKKALDDAIEAANISISSYKVIAAGVVPDNSLDGWVCENTNMFHINTWSVEGNSDGSNMKTPFIENWVSYQDSYLGAGKVYYQLAGLEPGEVYYAQALVRSYNEANADAPNGPNFFINDTYVDMTAEGTTFTYDGKSGIFATLGGAATVGEDGKLTLGVEIKEDRNYNWVAFKSVSIMPMADALAKAMNAAKAYQDVEMADDAKQALNSVINTYDGATLTTPAEYEAAIAALNEATEAAKAAVEAYKIAKYYIGLADGAYYIIDAASGKMMAAGHNYGTRGIVKEFGLDLTLTTNAEAHTVTFDSRVSNGGDNHFLGSNLYMDSPAFGWYLAKQDNGLFYITNDEQYISIDADENLVMSDEPYEWAIVSADAVIAAGIDEFANATAEAPVDATFLIKGANFNRNDARNGDWDTWSEDVDLKPNLKISDGNEVNNCAESYHAQFYVQQTIQGMPNGIYQLTAQGFYRQDGSDNEHLPVFYANGKTGTFPEKTGTENSMSDASASFTNGLYTIEPIKFTVVDGTITLGAKLEGNTDLWCIFDNFTLTFVAPFPITLDEEDDNTAKLEELDGCKADITLTRTLQEGSYNTFAVPFATAIPEGWTVKELTASEFNNATGLLSLTFGDALSIEAGKPYLVKVAATADLSLALFARVIVSATATTTETTAVDFIPTLGKTLVTGPTGNESNASTVLFLGANNTLLNPTELPAYMKGFRAYFQLKGDATQARAFSIDFGDGETTGIKAIDNGKLTIDNVVYDLQGRKVQNAAAKGMYIVNGKKVIIK